MKKKINLSQFKNLDDEFGSSYDPNQGIERWN